MKKKLSILCSLLMALQMILSAVNMPVFAEGGDEAGDEMYTAPESVHETFNMNLDWKFFDTKTVGIDLWEAVSKADKNGKKFYEKDYDDSDWDTVSIPHGIGGGTNSFAGTNGDSGGGYRSVLLYRKTFTVPQLPSGGKVFFELEGIRQAAYVWVNGQKVGYYEAGITAMGFDITKYVTSGEQAVIAIINDGTTTRGTTERYIHETLPGGAENRGDALANGIVNTQAQLDRKKDDKPTEDYYTGTDRRELQSRLESYQNLLNSLTEDEKRETWGTSFGDCNDKTWAGSGSGYVWNSKDFNEPQIGLVYDAYLHVTGSVYQTFPLYNNLKTTGNYIYADNFDIRSKKATIHVDAEVRNESASDVDYTLEVAVVDADGQLKYKFESETSKAAKAIDAGVVYETAVEDDVYSEENIAASAGLTKVNTPDVARVTVSYNAEGMRFWSTEDPYLYTVYTILKDKSGNVLDVQKKETGFRKVTYDENSGILINDRAVWMPGYAQRSTNEWAVIGVATDWLQDYDMALLKENNSNFIRWMHVAPKPNEVRSSDRYGVAVVCPAGDKEGVGLAGRQWSQRTEAMRDAMIYFRNSPSVIFWETGNSAVGNAANANDMVRLRDEIDPKGMRFIGARSATAADQMNYDYNYTGTMYGVANDNITPKDATKNAVAAMKSNGKPGPVMETEYARNEAPRRVWDLYSPPDYDYVNKFISRGGKKDGYDVWNETQEDTVIRNIAEYNGYYSNRAGVGGSIFSAAAMMIWSDSNMHTRNTATENCRTSGRVDPVRQTKEMFEATKTAQSSEAAIHIVGHWSYPELTDDTYNFYGTETVKADDNHDYEKYVKSDKKKRDPLHKTVYVIGSADVSKVELYRVDGEKETLLGTDAEADSGFIYRFDNIDVTKGDAVIAKAYDARGTQVTADEIKRTGDAVSLRLTPHTAVKENEKGETVADWRADGSDIAYIDVEVIDANGNVCALNYDKINFSYDGGEFGEYLGGYNSGSGVNCFHNTAETEGISFYFGGDKSGTTTLGKDYVYAENGTNRIFVRSTRKAGTFTLTASMDGMLPVSQSITSTSVDEYVTGGLSTLMQSVLAPGASEAPVTSTVLPVKPLMLGKKIIEWNNMTVVKEEDNTVYYDVYLNGEKLELNGKTYIGAMNTMFGPVYEILQAAQKAGANGFTMTYGDKDGLKELVVTVNGHTYQYLEERNQVLIDDTETTECVEPPKLKDGVFIANLDMMLGYAGIGIQRDETNHIFNITVQ